MAASTQTTIGGEDVDAISPAAVDNDESNPSAAGIFAEASTLDESEVTNQLREEAEDEITAAEADLKSLTLNQRSHSSGSDSEFEDAKETLPPKGTSPLAKSPLEKTCKVIDCTLFVFISSHEH